MNVMVIGDSHAQSVKSALKLDGNQISDSVTNLAVYKYKVKKNGIEGGDLTEDELLEKAAALESDDLIVSAVGGNQHHLLSLVKHPVEFTVLNDSEDTLPSCPIIPVRQIEDFFGDLLHKDISRLRAVRAASKCRIAHLCTPPPKKNEEFLLKHAGLTFQRVGISDHGISSAALRLTFWKIQCRVLQLALDSLPITLLPPPLAALDPSGFLAEPFYANDATHANQNYGRLLLEQIYSYSSSATSIRSD